MSAKKRSVRVATVNDLPLLLKWGKGMYLAEKMYMPLLKYSEKEATDRYRAQIDNPKFLFLIAEHNGIPVGYLYAHLDEIDYLDTTKPQCEIEVIYLSKEVRGFGLSQDLIGGAISWASMNGAFEVKAGIFSRNTASRKSFEKSDFKLIHTTYTKKI